jgi:hypothetical protein
MTDAPFPRAQSDLPGLRLLAAMRIGSPVLWRSAVAMTVLCLVCAALPLADDRLLNGVSVWQKPFKFFLSLAVHFATVSWAVSLLAEKDKARTLRAALTALATAGWLEMVYIVFRASRGEASHFATATAFEGVLYSLMGLGALTLTVTTGLAGYHLWRRRREGLWHEAAGLGLVVSAVLTTVVAGYLSSRTGHWVGGAQSDAGGLGFFSWSTTGGDLRVAHFVSLHAAQLVPLAALAGRRRVVWLTALAVTAVTIATFVQAIMGVPLFRA